MHEWLRMGDSFIADRLHIKDNDSLLLEFQTYGSKKLNYFHNAHHLARVVRVRNGHGIDKGVIGKYFIPINANFESADGLVFSASDTLILLQITIAKTHSMGTDGLKQLCDALPATIKNIHIVFVIPDNLLHQYLIAQTVPQASAVRPQKTDLTISQFRLILTKEKIQSMGFVSSFAMLDQGMD